MPMLSTIQRTAAALQWVKKPILGLAMLFLLAIFYILFTSPSHEGDRYLIPCTIGLLWSLSTFTFIINFCSLPPPMEKSAPFFSRLKRRLHRLWYGVLASLFFAATMSVLIVSYRLLSVWLHS